FSKVGGLADVAGALPKELKRLGHDVSVVTPYYSKVILQRQLALVSPSVKQVPMDGWKEPATIRETRMGLDIPVYLIGNENYFGRERVYSYPDDSQRFVFFCLAALQAMDYFGWQPDVIHCNDWHTALIPVWIKTKYRDDAALGRAATVYTIHNLAYKGHLDEASMAMAGVPAPVLPADLAATLNFSEVATLAIIYSDVVSTVSPTYAQEILTPEYGERLEQLLRYRKDRLFGIINGIDYEFFNPATDQYIVANYDAPSIEKKSANKLALQKEMNLAIDPETPLIGMVSRLADQKGFDLLEKVLDPLMHEIKVQLVILGTGDEHYHSLLTRLAEKYPQQIGLALKFDAALAQRIYAGSDMFLMPSRFEPCGLGQLISMRYGTVPVVRATGGLNDTVEDFDPVTCEGSGFVFKDYDSLALHGAIIRAVETFRQKGVWLDLARHIMSLDFSWTASARQYEELYQRAIAFREEAIPTQSTTS
ncbi:MAG: glycogen synthase, partial [Chloroflexi bacterium]|nr:glycogen synthase [Chloroflexota bacterium]